MAGSVCSANCPRRRAVAFRSASASARGLVSAIFRLAIFLISRLPKRALIPRPVTVESVSAEASTGPEATSFSSR